MNEIVEIVEIMKNLNANICIKDFLKRISGYYLEAGTNSVMLTPANETIYGLGQLSIELNSHFNNFNLPIKGFTIIPAEGYSPSDILPNDTQIDWAKSITQYVDENGIEKIKIEVI